MDKLFLSRRSVYDRRVYFEGFIAAIKLFGTLSDSEVQFTAETHWKSLFPQCTCPSPLMQCPQCWEGCWDKQSAALRTYAPDLLNACKIATDKLEELIPDWEQTHLRELIAKAEGRDKS